MTKISAHWKLNQRKLEKVTDWRKNVAKFPQFVTKL